MTKDKARSVVMGAISMALKDPTLQQGFEIICKNLADLEKENAELKEKLKEELKTIADKDLSFVARFDALEKENAELRENLKTAYRKGMRHMAKALKDYDRTDGFYTDYFEHSVDKVLQREQLEFEEYGTLADQLTKAKKIIQRLVTKLYKYTRFTDDVLAEAEQFLNEVEK